MRLTAEVTLVGGGPVSGFGLTGGSDSHVYLVDCGNELALIDCGLGSAESLDLILANVKAAGHDPRRITRLLLTHYHGDHAGGAAAYRAELGLAVGISAEAQAALESGDEEATSLAVARDAGIYPADYRLEGCRVDDPMRDGDARKIGQVEFHFFSTPGHCAGHGSYLMTGGDRPVLFAGDAVFWGGQVLLQAIHDCDLGASLESILRLDGLAFDALLPGHGPVTLRGGKEHVELAAKKIRALGVPRNLI